MKTILLLFAFLACCVTGRCQWLVGGGLAYGPAFISDGQISVKKPTMGLCAEAGYMPGDGLVFPSISYLQKRMAMPVRNDHFADLDDLVTCRNITLRLNYRTSREQHYKLFYLGVGIAGMLPEKTLYDQYDYPITLVDSIGQHLYPLVQVGARIMRRILPNSGFYLGMEAHAQYIHMHADGGYALQQNTIQVPAKINGTIVMPGIEVKVLYVFDKVERY